MKVFLAGATGVIGVRLVPLLVNAGHEVTGMTRSEAKRDELRGLGAEPVVCDVFDAARLMAVVGESAPDAVMHQLTDLPDQVEDIPLFAPRNNRIRTEGTRNLITAARAAGAERFVAQSIAWTPPAGGEAVAEHERLVLEFGGVVVRYGTFYGPGTYSEARIPPRPRIHIDDAARLTVPLLDSGGGVVVIAEEEGGGRG